MSVIKRKSKPTLRIKKSDLVLIQTKKERIFIFSLFPAKINDWMVGYIVPVHAAQESYTFITHYETLLATFLD